MAARSCTITPVHTVLSILLIYSFNKHFLHAPQCVPQCAQGCAELCWNDKGELDKKVTDLKVLITRYSYIAVKHMCVCVCVCVRVCVHVCVLVTPSCPTVCYPVDYNPPGSSVRGVLQARILEWIPISFSRGSSQPRDQTWMSCMQADSLCLSQQGRFLMSDAQLLSTHRVILALLLCARYCSFRVRW